MSRWVRGEEYNYEAGCGFISRSSVAVRTEEFSRREEDGRVVMLRIAGPWRVVEDKAEGGSKRNREDEENHCPLCPIKTEMRKTTESGAMSRRGEH